MTDYMGSHKEDRLVEDVISFVAYLDSNLGSNASLADIHRRVSRRWKMVSKQYEPHNLRTHWIWLNNNWEKLPDVYADQAIIEAEEWDKMFESTYPGSKYAPPSF
jgi:hypothetical protein